MSYYKVIDGKKYDAKLIEWADQLTKNQSANNTISLADAEELLKAVKDGDKYTDIEKDTIAYIRENYKWTEGSDQWFRTEIRSWAATK